MEVIEYNKSLLTRLEEATEVLNCTSSRVGASDVASQWAYYIECYVEPSGKMGKASVPM